MGLGTALSIGLDLFLISVGVEDLADTFSILSPVVAFVKGSRPSELSGRVVPDPGFLAPSRPSTTPKR
jgi:hypothetical protein